MEKYDVSNKEYCYISKSAAELYSNENEYKTYDCALEMMQDCADYIYNLAHPYYPKAYIPDLYLAKTDEVNALADPNGKIVIFSGLLKESILLIEKRFNDDLIKRYNILPHIPPAVIRSAIRVNLWRYIYLHELYHLWHRHAEWKQNYAFVGNGILLKRSNTNSHLFLNKEIEFEANAENNFANINLGQIIAELNYQRNITQQALEFDCDSCAVSMLINLMMRDMNARNLPETEKPKHTRTELALIMGALSTAFCLFDNNSGAKFESLKYIDRTTHPLPAIRMVYAEEIADACMWRFTSNPAEHAALEEDWQKIVCNVDADYEGTVDMGQVFYYPAYTEKAQKHISLLKRRLIAMHDSMKSLSIANFPEKLEMQDTQISKRYIWFDENGVSLRGWVNPATGNTTAIKKE